MISCKEVATLLTTDQIQTGGLWNRLKVGLHLSMCRHCALLRRQLRLLGSATRLVRSSIDTEKSAESLDARLLKKLKEK